MEDNEEPREDMENLRAPLPPLPGPEDPRMATHADIVALSKRTLLTKSIAGAASLYAGSCEGGDVCENNCAHYLSDAFLHAGYDDLKPPAACINARCATTARRAIRARDMWCWFKAKKTEERISLPSNEGFWAVFQLKEDEYWGGHVLIIDTDNNVAYGTGNYPNWDQYCYKW